MKCFNEIPWWAKSDSVLTWSWEERVVSGVILGFGCFLSMAPIFIIGHLFEKIGLDKHVSAFVSFMICLPSSILAMRYIYAFLFPDFFKRAEINAGQRLSNSGGHPPSFL
jgi:hypothetical protein